MKSVIQGSRKRGKRIQWLDDDRQAPDLTSAVITARIINMRTGVAFNSDGAFAVVNPGTQGIFTWAFGTLDTATAGDFYVQFTATYPDTLIERTYQDTLTVLPAIP